MTASSKITVLIYLLVISSFLIYSALFTIIYATTQLTHTLLTSRWIKYRDFNIKSIVILMLSFIIKFWCFPVKNVIYNNNNIIHTYYIYIYSRNPTYLLPSFLRNSIDHFYNVHKLLWTQFTWPRVQYLFLTAINTNESNFSSVNEF